jgi:hypothetical protein
MLKQFTAREILEFLVRHQTHRSVKAIAEFAGVDTGNLHACLSGRRPLPAITIRRVGAAVGLKVANPEERDPQLELVPDTVMHLEVKLSEISVLAQILRALTSATVTWRCVSALWSEVVEVSAATLEQPGVYSLALGRLPQGYVVLHIFWPSLREAQESNLTFSKIQEHLGGTWISEADTGLSASDTLWIALRAGMGSVRSLDKLLGVSAEPTGEDWARMLLSITSRGLTPDIVLGLVESTCTNNAARN